MVDLRMPTDAPSLADGVMRAVRDGISSGRLDPGETYSVYQLADQLGVSRSPVREGLLRLAEAGLVVISRNRGFRVVQPTRHDIEEIIEIRLALEPRAAARAASGGSDDQHGAIRQALADMEVAAAADIQDDFWRADRAVHDLLLRTAGNARAAKVVAELRATTSLLGPPTTASGRTLREIYAEHEPVVRAVLARDSRAAKRSMRAHLRTTGRLLAANPSLDPAPIRETGAR